MFRKHRSPHLQAACKNGRSKRCLTCTSTAKCSSNHNLDPLRFRLLYHTNSRSEYEWNLTTTFRGHPPFTPTRCILSTGTGCSIWNFSLHRVWKNVFNSWSATVSGTPTKTRFVLLSLFSVSICRFLRICFSFSKNSILLIRSSRRAVLTPACSETTFKFPSNSARNSAHNLSDSSWMTWWISSRIEETATDCPFKMSSFNSCSIFWIIPWSTSILLAGWSETDEDGESWETDLFVAIEFKWVQISSNWAIIRSIHETHEIFPQENKIWLSKLITRSTNHSHTQCQTWGKKSTFAHQNNSENLQTNSNSTQHGCRQLQL